jgi:dCTP deaminase
MGQTEHYGVLTDNEIRQAASEKYLIIDNFDDSCLNQACYELRASEIYYDLTEGTIPIKVKDGEEILIKPHHTIVAITTEKLSIPDNIIARIVSKGSLFSCGLMPVSTIADPGFIGQLGIVLHNITESYVILPVGEKIAKIDFTRIGKNVTSRYSGQHGYGTQVWPVKTQFIKTFEQIKGHSRVRNELEETLAVSSPVMAASVRTIFKYQRMLFLSMVLLFVVNIFLVFLIANIEGALNLLLSVMIGVAGNVVYGIIVWKATRLEGRKK